MGGIYLRAESNLNVVYPGGEGNRGGVDGRTGEEAFGCESAEDTLCAVSGKMASFNGLGGKELSWRHSITG
jgi:hypothetical protein